MLESIFSGLFDSGLTSVISVADFLLCVGSALLIGLFLAAVYTYKSHYTKGFVTTLAVLPAVVCVVIMMVNGNVGAGVAVAGAFSLVRFRSVPGSARDIGAIFLSMGAGLMAGMGYLAYAALFALILGAVTLALGRIGFGVSRSAARDKTLRVEIPENLNYTNVFEDLLERYTESHTVVLVKTTNMGSLFKITYDITLKDPALEKEMIDALRCRNGNLEISVSEQVVGTYEL